MPYIGTYVTQITWSLVCVFVKLQVSLIRIQHEAIQFGYIIQIQHRAWAYQQLPPLFCVCYTSNICVVFQCQNLYILAVQTFGTAWPMKDTRVNFYSTATGACRGTVNCVHRSHPHMSCIESAVSVYSVRQPGEKKSAQSFHVARAIPVGGSE